MDAAREILDLALRRPPTVGGETRLIVVDGPAGSGKTTLAAAVAALEPAAAVLHIDDLLEGWAGIGGATDQFDSFLLPLSRGEPGSYRRYDWYAAAFAETVAVPVTPLLVVEGVGSGSRSHARWHTVLVWVETDDERRLARGMARDGEGMRAHWEQWMRDEVGLFAREGTRRRADVLLAT